MPGSQNKSDRNESDEASDALEYDFLSDSVESMIFSQQCDFIIPYHLRLKKTLVECSNILINGLASSSAVRFTIDLCTHVYDAYKQKRKKEIVFHFCPEFQRNYVKRNSYINNEWGQEEIHASKLSPFQRGQIFEIEIYVIKSEYLVSVNGVHFCSFTHRIHPSSVDSIEIYGDIKLLNVEISMKNMYSSREKTIFLEDDLQNKMTMPFYHEFKYPLMESWDLIISGTVLDLAERFTVDLCSICDKCSKRHSDIVFHFNPRLTQNYVARNSKIHDEWGHEESHAIKSSPFRRGQRFHLEIFLTKTEYMVSIDGQHFCSFKHRLSSDSVSYLEINGDVALQRIDLSKKDSYPTQEENYFNLNPSLIGHQPITQSISELLTIDTIIEIKGRVLLLPNEFYVNLQKGTKSIPHPIIPYHLSLRWRPFEADTSVLNSWITDHWGEEVVLCPLLRPNSNFIITIYVKKEGFSTVIKAPIKPYSTVLPLYVHKAEPNIINTIHIQGDVQVFSINVKKV